MRKLILAILLILCMCVYASAGTTVVVVQGVAAGAATCTGAAPTGCTGRETFDGSTDCGDDPNNAQTCDNTWTLLSHSYPDYTGNADCTDTEVPYVCCTGSEAGTCPAAVEGTYSMNVQDNWTNNPTIGISATDEIVVASMFRTSGTNTNYVIQLRDTSSNDLCRAENGGGSFLKANNTGGSTGGDGLTLNVDTDYYVRVRAKKGTGANAQCEVWVSTDGTNWGTSSSSTNGTWTAQVEKIGLSPGNNNAENIMDDIRWLSGSSMDGTEVSY